jgi:hypothetical protein
MKTVLSIFALALSLFVVSCGSESSDNEPWYTDHPVGTSATYTVTPYGWNVHRVNFPAAGTYTIRVENLGSDCGVTYCSYDENAKSADDLVDDVIKEIEEYGDSTDEAGTITVASAGYAFLVVDEFDKVDSHYTLSIESGDTLPSAAKVITEQTTSAPEADLNQLRSSKNKSDKWSN